MLLKTFELKYLARTLGHLAMQFKQLAQQRHKGLAVGR